MPACLLVSQGLASRKSISDFQFIIYSCFKRFLFILVTQFLLVCLLMFFFVLLWVFLLSDLPVAVRPQLLVHCGQHAHHLLYFLGGEFDNQADC
jgi:hypothetical protein